MLIYQRVIGTSWENHGQIHDERRYFLYFAGNLRKSGFLSASDV
jgi:hypothetical protein